MAEVKKTALGCKPAWMCAWARIADLNEAIRRQYEIADGDECLVKRWAQEIIMQTQIIRQFRETEEA